MSETSVERIAKLRTIGEFRLDEVEEALWIGQDETIQLTATQFRLLSHFVDNAGKWLKTEELAENKGIWGASITAAGVRNHVMDLRNLVGDKPPYKYIASDRTRGYRFVAEVASAASIAPETPGLPRTHIGASNPPETVIDAGLLAGPVAGAVVGLVYYLRYPFIGPIRVVLMIIYGLFAGGVFGVTTQFIVPRFGRLSTKHTLIPRNTWVRTVLLCVLAGVGVGALTAIFFWSVGVGPPISGQLLMFGYLLTAVCVEMTVIFHDYSWHWRNVARAIGACLSVSFVHFAVGTIVVIAFQDQWNSAFRSFAAGGHPILAGCSIGALIGGLMGSQMSLTVSVFRHWQRMLAGQAS